MKVHYLKKDEKAKENSLVCVIDVLRAFTTSAYAFANGAKKIILSSSSKEAFQIKEENPDYILTGESGGIKIEGFEYGNSPVELSKAKIKDKVLVQKTSNGTVAVINNLHAKKVIVSSFVVAEATFKFIKKYIEENNIEDVYFVITNDFRSTEDTAFADYITEKLFGNVNYSAKPYLDIVKNCRYATMQRHIVDEEDVKYIIDIDKFNFVMEVDVSDSYPFLKTLEI